MENCIIRMALVLFILHNCYAADVVCGHDEMSIVVNNTIYHDVQFFLLDKDNSSCRFTQNDTHSSITVSYNECGTTSTQDATHIIYKNSVKNYINQSAIINRDPLHQIDIECKLVRSVNASSDGQLAVTQFDSINITEDAFGTFTLNLDLYKTESYNTAYQQNEYPINLKMRDELYVQLELDTSNGEVKMIPQNCYATPTSSVSDNTKYYIFQDRCVDDDTYHNWTQSSKTFQFSFESFQFTNQSNGIYLHCEVVVCKSDSSSSACSFTCGSGKKVNGGHSLKKRSIDDEISNTYVLTSKQIIFGAKNNKTIGKGTSQDVDVKSVITDNKNLNSANHSVSVFTVSILSGVITLLIVVLVLLSVFFKCRAMKSKDARRRSAVSVSSMTL